jgi:formylmethanofuran dehydrogenase subunit E
MKTLNLQLHITKNHNLKDYQTGKYIRFAVTDLDISKRYPSNFVTILPRHIYLKAKIPSNFVKKYEEQSHKIAKKLLKKALRTHEDQEIKKEIRERLKLLAPKPKNIIKCNICGKEFESRKYKYGPRKTCYPCKSKMYQT